MPYGNDYGYEDDDDDEDELMAYNASASRDAVLICIDASTSMQTLRSAESLGLDADDDGSGGEATFFAGALDCAFQLEKRKALVSPGDYVGIVVYNTTKAMDDHPDAEASGIYVLHSLGPIQVDQCKALKELVEKAKSDPAAFQSEFPPMHPDDRNWVAPPSLFTYANSEMRDANVKNGNRRIFLVTDDDDPCRVKAAQDALASQSQKISPRKKKLTKEAARFGRVEDGITDVSRTADRVRDFMQLGADVIPFFLSSEDHEFDASKFWEPALMRSFSTGDQGPSALGGLAALRDLQSGLTVRQSSKRSLWTLPLTISEDLVIGVKGYALLMEAKKPSTQAFNTEGDRPIELQRQTTYYDAKDHHELDPSEYAQSLRYMFQNSKVGSTDLPPELRRQDEQNATRPMDVVDDDGAGGKDVKRELPEGSNANEHDLAWGVGLKKREQTKPQPQVTWTKADIAQIGTCGLKPGIRVLGYQSRSCVSFERNVRSPYFLRPTEETHTIGSTRAFVAFMRCMLDRDVVAIALCMFRRSSSPQICALVPQEETFIPAGDVTGSQDKPPGLHVIQFPFLDDMRELPQILQGAGGLIPDPQHVGIMQKIIKKLTARAGYNPEDIPNPTLARYFAELEARAFQDEFDGEQVEDRSLPITDVMKKRAGELLVQFKSSIAQDPRASEPAPKAPTKRAAAGDDVPASKRQKAAPDEDEPDMADVRAAWKSGKLAKFTVKQLKPFLRHHTSTQPGGPKAELVAAVQKYFDDGEQ